MDNNELVSIVVITYNQSRYILETLESTRLQTYKNIELVIADDCSTDDTVAVCTEWLKNNCDRFLNSKSIVPPKNTGTAINCNRGINASTGRWIKILSGDDILTSNSIEEYVKFVTKNEYEICCCKLKLFGDDQDLIKKSVSAYNKYYTMINDDWKYQKKNNARQLFVPGPGLFFSKDLFDCVGGFDEKYPFAEEWPFTTKIFNTGNKIHLLDKYLYNYRIYTGSLCRDELGMNKRVFSDMREYFFHRGFFELIKNGDILYAWHSLLTYCYLSIKYESVKDSFLYRYAKLILFFSPIACIKFIKRIMIPQNI
jgi:alpha-1,3-rhamnosyltransferase